MNLPGRGDFVSRVGDWCEESDRFWDRRGLVSCPACVGMALTNKLPPEYCPYAAEHVVSQNAE